MVEVSVIVPIYNGVNQGLEKCLISLLDQSSEEIEVICIDDSSVDDSYALANKYAVNHGWTLVSHERNMGLSASLNDGITRSNGKYVMVLQQDCYLIDKDSISKSLEEFEKNKSIGVIVGRQIYDFSKLNFYQKSVELRLEHLYLNSNIRGYTDLTENKCDMILRKVIDEVGLFNEEQRISGEDQIFSAIVRKRGYKMMLSNTLRYRNALLGENTFIRVIKKEIIYGKYAGPLLLKLRNISTPSGRYSKKKTLNRISAFITFAILFVPIVFWLITGATFLLSIILTAPMFRWIDSVLKVRKLRIPRDDLGLSTIKTSFLFVFLDLFFVIYFFYGFIVKE